MKKWLKRYGRWVIVALGVLFIANSVYGILNASSESIVVLHSLATTLWVLIMLFFSGLALKLYEWWMRD